MTVKITGLEDSIKIEEGERQMIILSLALCSLLRPGFYSYAGEIASKFHGGSNAMFEEFRKYNENVKPVGSGVTGRV